MGTATRTRARTRTRGRTSPTTRSRTGTRARASTRDGRGTGTTAKPARALSEKHAIALARTIIGSRRDFADAFRQAQAGRRDLLEFEAVASGTVDETAAYALAFRRAAERDWLDELCVACLNAQIVSGGFTRVAARVSDDGRLAPLQQIVDAHLGIPDAGLLVARLPKAIRQVCRIEIDGNPKGTGFLIRSDLVMTAYHVVKTLLEPDKKTMSPGTAAKLKVRFDFSKSEGPSGEVTLVDGFVCRVADPWLVDLSPCTDDEILDKVPDDEEKLKDFWDFAIIQLAETPGVARNGLEIANLRVARGHRLMILQHPDARPVGVASSTVRRFLGKSDTFRIVHGVNTEPGSSGSPCLNDDFKVVGLHQGAMPDNPKRRKNSEEAKENRAVPMPRILGVWDLKQAPPPALPFRRLLTVDTKDVLQHPVFGRGKLQEWIARSAADGGAGPLRDRFLVVAGKKGLGKSFTIEVLRAMLPAGEHSVLECQASDFSTEATALGFATKYLLSPLGADASTLPALGQANTSDNAWLNYQLIGDLLNVMDQSRKKRMVWVVLDELEEIGVPEGQVRKLLDLLYSRAEKTPWMRFLLLELEAVPVPGTGAFTERDFPGPATETALATDVGDYLMRRLDGNGLFWPEPLVRATVVTNVQKAVLACKGEIDHPELMKRVVEDIVLFEANAGLRPSGGS